MQETKPPISPPFPLTVKEMQNPELREQHARQWGAHVKSCGSLRAETAITENSDESPPQFDEAQFSDDLSWRMRQVRGIVHCAERAAMAGECQQDELAMALIGAGEMLDSLHQTVEEWDNWRRDRHRSGPQGPN